MHRIACVALCALLPGCNTLADAVAAKGSGLKRTYVESRDVVWRAAVDAVQESELELVMASEADGKIFAQRGVSLGSYGENVVIWVEEQAPPPGTRVEIVTKRAMSTNIFAPNWGSNLFAKLDRVLSPATAESPKLARTKVSRRARAKEAASAVAPRRVLRVVAEVESVIGTWVHQDPNLPSTIRIFKRAAVAHSSRSSIGTGLY